MPGGIAIRAKQPGLPKSSLPQGMPMQTLKFPQGPAGRTGEVYYTVGILRGQQLELVKDPHENYLVFKDKHIAERIQHDFLKLQDDDPSFFTSGAERAIILVLKIETGEGGKVVIPDLGYITTPGGIN